MDALVISVAEFEALVGPVHPESDTAWELRAELKRAHRARQDDDAELQRQAEL